MGAHGIRIGAAKASNREGSATEKVGFIRSGPDAGATHYTVGYEYGFLKRTSVFAYQEEC